MAYTIKDYLSVRKAGAPTFNASGSKIAYLSNEQNDTYQIYVRSLDADDATRLTNYDDGIGFVDFSPTDDSLILFSKDTGGNELAALYLMNADTGDVTLLTNNPKAQHVPGGWSRDGRFIMYTSNARNGIDRDIFLYDCAEKSHSLLAESTDWTAAYGFSPSGRYVITAAYQSNVNNDLLLIDRQGDPAPKLLLAHDNANLYRSPRWLPDESGFFLISNKDSEFGCLYFYDLATNTLELIHDYGWDVEGLAFTRDGSLLFVWVNEDGYSRVHYYDVDGKQLSKIDRPLLTDGEIGSAEFSPDGTKLIYDRSAYNSALNIWLWDRASSDNRMITTIELPVATDDFAKPELNRFTSFDALSVPAFLYMPTSLTGPCPVVVSVHGGPEGQSRPGLAMLIQYWVSHGYAVIEPNVRGSTGYGRTYVGLDDTRKRLDSVEDLRALHAWAESDPRIDAGKMALFGGSYGGYMVLAGLAFQPELWAAGIDIVGIANFVTFLQNTSPYRRKLRESEYGSLEHDREFLETASPINKADDIVVPLFIIHGANDPRVPLSEAEQVYESLRSRGVTSEFLVYDDEGHGLAKLKNRLDAYPKVAEFLQKVLEP